MKAYIDCYPCFFNQTIKTARRITKDEKKIWEILNQVSKFIPQIPFGATPPEIGREIYRIISEQTGVEDPFQEIKKDCIQQALSLYPEMRKKRDSSRDPLMTAIRLSIAGNVIDFGTSRTFDLEKDVRQILSQDFAVCDYDEFLRGLEKASRILYIADNAGETVFDRFLLEVLPVPITYVVRGQAIINDATKEDARISGIEKEAFIVSSGCDAPGTIMNLCSEEFSEMFRSADLIISKGQGNYEGLSEEPLPIFFLLKAKCGVIAEDLGVEKGSIVLKKSSQIN
ncbi:DUF89 family protein [bacterium]|nr:DUF89 family protein [bacterium]